MSRTTGIVVGQTLKSVEWYLLGINWRGRQYICFRDCTLDGIKLDPNKKYRIPKRRKHLLFHGSSEKLYFVDQALNIPSHPFDQGQKIKFVVE